MAPIFYSLNDSESDKFQVAELEELRSIYNSQNDQYARFGVGLYPDGEFGQGVDGFSYFWARRSVMVGDGSKNEYAHEALPHEMGHEFFGDEYNKDSIGENLPNNVYIYDGQNKELTNLANYPGGRVNIMGNAGTVSNLWVNQETWNKLVQEYGFITSFNTNSSKIAAMARYDDQQSAGFMISGFISTDDLVTIRNLLALNKIPVEKMFEGDYWIDVFDHQGSLVGHYPIEVEFTDGESEAFFLRNVPAAEGTAELRILHKDTVIWRSQASKEAPQVSINALVGSSPLSGRVNVSWQSHDVDSQNLNFMLLYSHNHGETWVPLATHLTTTSYEVNFDTLPGGKECLIRVIASDGWNSTIVDIAPSFEVIDKPAEFILELPKDGMNYSVGDLVRFNSYVVDLESGWVDDRSIVWKSSIDGQLGSGSILAIDDLSPGEHEITAVFMGANNTQVERKVHITIGGLQNERNNKIIRYGILAEIALAFFVGGAILLIVFIRKHKKIMMVIMIIEVFCAFIFLGYSVILFASAIKMNRVNTSIPTSAPEIDQVLQPSIPLPNTTEEVLTETIVTEAIPEDMKRTEVIESDGFIAEYNIISLHSLIGNGFSSESVNADIGPDSFFGQPSHDKIILDEYPVENTLFEPVIKIYRVEEYLEDEDASTLIGNLQQLIVEHPEKLPQELPMLPIQPCGMQGFAKFAYQDFASGSGIRYLTECVQNTWPITNNLLFYTFQGITNDGQYYISVIMPITHSSLDEYADFLPSDDFISSGIQIIADQFTELDGSENESFKPSITDLDDLVKSITVSPN